MSRYITHARTLEELRSEFLTDIQRRLDQLDSHLKITKNASESARIARGRMELLSLFDFWKEIELQDFTPISTSEQKEPLDVR